MGIWPAGEERDRAMTDVYVRTDRLMQRGAEFLEAEKEILR